MSKLCSRCEQDLPPAEFHKYARSPSGLQAWCRTCTAEFKREWRARRNGR